MPKVEKSADLADGSPDDAASAAEASNARYAEYVRLLDEAPVLLDVVSEPPRVVIRDFRLGQRPNVRQLPREDAYSVHERRVAELEVSFAEYAHAADGGLLTEMPPKRPSATPKAKRPRSGGKRSKRRKV